MKLLLAFTDSLNVECVIIVHTKFCNQRPGCLTSCKRQMVLFEEVHHMHKSCWCQRYIIIHHITADGNYPFRKHSEYSAFSQAEEYLCELWHCGSDPVTKVLVVLLYYFLSVMNGAIWPIRAEYILRKGGINWETKLTSRLRPPK